MRVCPHVVVESSGLCGHWQCEGDRAESNHHSSQKREKHNQRDAQGVKHAHVTATHTVVEVSPAKREGGRRQVGGKEKVRKRGDKREEAHSTNDAPKQEKEEVSQEEEKRSELLPRHIHAVRVERRHRFQVEGVQHKVRAAHCNCPASAVQTTTDSRSTYQTRRTQ